MNMQCFCSHRCLRAILMRLMTWKVLQYGSRHSQEQTWSIVIDNRPFGCYRWCLIFLRGISWGMGLMLKEKLRNYEIVGSNPVLRMSQRVGIRSQTVSNVWTSVYSYSGSSSSSEFSSTTSVSRILIIASLIGSRLRSTKTGPISLHISSRASTAHPLTRLSSSSVIMKMSLGISMVLKCSSISGVNLSMHGRPFLYFGSTPPFLDFRYPIVRFV